MIRFVLSTLAAALFSLGGLIPAASADLPQPVKAAVVQPIASAWTFEFSPYLWAAGVQGRVDVGPIAPLVNVDVGFGDILRHLQMAFMGTFEARYDKWGFIADVDYIAAKVSASGPLGFVDAKLTDKTTFATFAVAYRFVDQRNLWVDAIAGGRAWWLSDRLNITAPGPTSLSVTRDQSWFDPVIGLRARAYVNPQFFVQLYVDAGGFGVGAKSDWQIAGLLGYDYSRSITFFGGYRYMAVNYNRNSYVFDVNLSGPTAGMTFKF